MKAILALTLVLMMNVHAQTTNLNSECEPSLASSGPVTTAFKAVQASYVKRSPAAKIESVYQMFHNPKDALDVDPNGYRLTKTICSVMLAPRGLGKKYVGGGALHKPLSETSYRAVKRFIKLFNAPPIETFFGDFVCESRYPVLYYAVKEGLCGDAYGFLMKLRQLRDDGIISQGVLRTILTEGPLHPNRHSGQKPYNVMELFEGEIPGRSAGHNEWCKFIKNEFEKELGITSV